MAYCLNSQTEVPPSCSDGLIVVTPTEYLERNPFALDVSSAQTIGYSIVAVWAVAFAFRAVGKYVGSLQDSGQTEEE